MQLIVAKNENENENEKNTWSENVDSLWYTILICSNIIYERTTI